MKKYITERNTPPTDREAELFACLAEEASEVIKEVCKITRSGLQHAPPGSIANVTRLEIEIGDFLAILSELTRLGTLGEDRIQLAVGDKLYRLPFFLLHSPDEA